jgi:hypothetical protein
LEKKRSTLESDPSETILLSIEERGLWKGKETGTGKGMRNERPEREPRADGKNKREGTLCWCSNAKMRVFVF